VPGILQTEDYAWAVHQAQLISATNEEINRLVKVRMARQEALSSADAPQLWLILNEAVIRRIVGNPTVMQEQLEHLIEASRLPNLTLQVIPFNAGAHAAMDGSFILLGFPEPNDPRIVYIEYHTGALYLEKQPEVERYRLAFDYLRASALPVDASRALMARLAAELP
jgi:Domain of unknown function (DUF5753)